MNKKLITNNETLLKDVINGNLPITSQFDVLVGYFYFSGFHLIAHELKDKPVRILVGMSAETTVTDQVVEVETDKINNKAHNRSRYLENLQKYINSTNEFDNEETVLSWEIFLGKLRDGTMEIRQTNEPNHSKMYLFYKSERVMHGESRGTLITGSSNLTRSGFAGRSEANVVLIDGVDFEAGVEYFEGLWRDAGSLVDKSNISEFETTVVNKVWLGKEANPFLMYLKVLQEYFSVRENDIKTANDIDKSYDDLSYQRDAVSKALDIINDHNGVIIADVVGLGKSIISSVIAHNLKYKGIIKKTVVIAPPHLVEQWQEYSSKFDFNAKVYSSGKIAEALKKEQSDEEKLIIVDEAHKFRNELTLDYEYLHQLCQGNKVMLLSATPFNNSPSDIYALIKLFQIPGASTIKTVVDLSDKFSRIITTYKQIKTSKKITPKDQTELDKISRQLKTMIEPLVIRRSRIDLKTISEYRYDLVNKNISFAKVNDPFLVEYDLGDIADIYIKTLEVISTDDNQDENSTDDSKKGNEDVDTFKAAKYQPLNYLRLDSLKLDEISEKLNLGNIGFAKVFQKNLAKFMKMLLVRRFESSIAAFDSSLDNMIRYHQNTIDWYDKFRIVAIYKKGQLPTVEDIMEGYNNDNDLEDDEYYEDILNKSVLIEGLTKKGMVIVGAEEFEPEFRQALSNDLKILENIKQNWSQLVNQKTDPKFDEVLLKIQGNLLIDNNKKIIVFSEFADTVDYLYTRFKNAGIRVIKYTSKDKNKRSEIIKNFDAGVKKSDQLDDYDVLVATDAISEGYNLHRAGIIVNYDIPYNPTRVIQRVGRINRINKKMFDTLDIYNFFPSFIGTKYYRVKDLSSIKMRFIHNLLGEDAKVIKSDEIEELSTFLKTTLKKAEENSDELSWDSRFRELLNTYKTSKSDLYQHALELPQRSRCARKNYDLNTLNQIYSLQDVVITEDTHPVLVFAKKGSDYFFKLQFDELDMIEISPEEAIALFEADEAEISYKLSDTFYKTYSKIEADVYSNYDPESTDMLKTIAMFNKYDDTLNDLEIDDDYFDDLRYKVLNLRALSDSSVKYIRTLEKEIDKAKTKEEVETVLSKLKARIPQVYLNRITKRQQSINDRPETVLLVEELIKENI